MGVFCQFIGLLLLLRFSNAYRHHSSPRHPIVSITKQLAFRGSSTAKANIQRHIPRSRYIKSHNYDQSLCSSRGGIPESWRDQIPDISEFLGDSSEEYFPASATTDFYLEDGMDEEIIERLRLERQLDNDRWQSCNFRDNHCGKFEGGYDLLLPIYDGDRGLSLQRIAHGECASKFTPTNWAPHGVNVSIQDTFKQESSEFVIPQGMTNLFLKEIQSTLLPSDFRTVKGIQNVGSAYSMTRIDEAGSEFITELAIRMGNCRTRVRYGYTLNNRCRSLSDDERNSNKFQLSLSGILVIRESNDEASPDELMRLYSKEPGMGIYDPQASGEPYVNIELLGRLSLMFPRGLTLDGPSIMTMEMIGEKIRLQCDRRAETLANGAIKSLELTEIKVDDAEKYVPVEPKFKIN